MASPRFDANMITAAKRLHDPRTAASSDPKESTLRYSQVLLEKYQSVAIRNVIKAVYQAAPERFSDLMPEMTKESADVTLTLGVGDVPTDCWIVLEVTKNDYSWYGTRIRDNHLKVKAGRDGMIQPTNTKPAFYQSARTIVVLPSSVTGPARLWYIVQPGDMTAGFATDIPISPMWDGDIVDQMVAMGLADAKSSIAV